MCVTWRESSRVGAAFPLGSVGLVLTAVQHEMEIFLCSCRTFHGSEDVLERVRATFQTEPRGCGVSPRTV